MRVGSSADSVYVAIVPPPKRRSCVLIAEMAGEPRQQVGGRGVADHRAEEPGERVEGVSGLEEVGVG